MVTVTVGEYLVSVAEALPAHYEHDAARATLIERFDLERESGALLYVAVRRGHDWPFLIVAQRYEPISGECPHSGVLLVPETHVLFLGAGERTLAYSLDTPARLWEYRTDFEFHGWQRHDDNIVLSAELELAAWDLHGAPRWSTFVEPPWAYHVEATTVYLDVMGVRSSFPLRVGPVSR